MITARALADSPEVHITSGSITGFLLGLLLLSLAGHPVVRRVTVTPIPSVASPEASITEETNTGAGNLSPLFGSEAEAALTAVAINIAVAEIQAQGGRITQGEYVAPVSDEAESEVIPEATITPVPVVSPVSIVPVVKPQVQSQQQRAAPTSTPTVTPRAVTVNRPAPAPTQPQPQPVVAQPVTQPQPQPVVNKPAPAPAPTQPAPVKPAQPSPAPVQAPTQQPVAPAPSPPSAPLPDKGNHKDKGNHTGQNKPPKK